MSGLFEILVIAILVAVNGVFVAAEIALVTVRRSRIRQLSDEGDKRAKRVGRMVAKPGRLLATIQLGITFIGFLAAAFAGASIAQNLADTLRDASGGPVILRNAWRPQSYNALVSTSAIDSDHPNACALDLDFQPLPDAEEIALRLGCRVRDGDHDAIRDSK